MTRQDTHGILCRTCRHLHLWRDLDVAIISDGEGGLVWLWACGGTVLRTEPFAYPADMPASTTEIEDFGSCDPRFIR